MGDPGDAEGDGRIPSSLASLEVRRIKAAARAKLFGDAGGAHLQAHPQQIARYTVLQQLGVGGMGEVYLAYDGELGRKVAIKLVRLDRDSGLERLSSRLLREAQALAQLSHPNVVQVYETGRFEGRVFIAMEFVRGVHMRKWLDMAPRTWRQVLDAFVQAGQGLAAAHRRGMVHRDFKPENVLVGEDGRVRVVDFGLVRNAPAVEDEPGEPGEHASAEDLERSSRLTQSGALMGTPSYMSPEQFQGLKATAKSDQFAFCVALYRGLYGWHPFASETRAELKRRVLGGLIAAPPRDAGVPAGILTVLTRGLEPDPERRYPSMEALLAALAAPPRRRRLGLILGAGLVASAALAVGLAGHWPGRACAITPTAIDPAVAANIAGSGLPYAAPLAARVTAQLERRARALALARAGLCADAFTDARLHDRHAACLDRRQRELDVAARALARLPPAALADAGLIVESLPSLAPCFDPDALAGPDLGPPEGRDALDEARVFALVGDHDAATQKAKRVFEQAACEVLRAEALALLGRLAFVRGAADDGRKLLEQALFSALARRDDDLVADIWRTLAELTGDDTLAHTALAAAERLRDPARVAASARLRAEIALATSGFRTAQSMLDRALAGADDSPATAARIELLLARIRGEQGRPERAAEHLDHALALAADLPGHPVLADALAERAHLELRAGRHAAARLRLGEALSIYSAFPNHDGAVARLHLELADLAVTDGQDSRAYDHYRAAIAATSRTPDALPRPDLTRAREALSNLLQRTGHGNPRPAGPPEDMTERAGHGNPRRHAGPPADMTEQPGHGNPGLPANLPEPPGQREPGSAAPRPPR